MFSGDSLIGFLVFLVIVFLDGLMYGMMFERKICGQEYGSGIYGWWGVSWMVDRLYGIFWRFWNWLFAVKWVEPVRYRILQKVIEVGGLFLVFWYGGIWQVVGILWAFYWLLNDYGYYVLTGQLWIAKGYKQAVWLTAMYQSGYWILNPYDYRRFRLSAAIGLIGLVISTFIKIII